MMWIYAQLDVLVCVMLSLPHVLMMPTSATPWVVSTSSAPQPQENGTVSNFNASTTTEEYFDVSTYQLGLLTTVRVVVDC